ncbi:branched-chain amino acid ABC transporter substrate-binding protein [Shinella zoogloeoides]|uniref:branched-chain amino acid ABC transporter substrate-binding protein n=1 Tax=Shinella zoogloeoides TaxID=352475 RepID=UPI000E6524BA|nr:branched-chain amino acid ABC transporter substrate-binding protein [Shinella zoogloeoides]
MKYAYGIGLLLATVVGFSNPSLAEIKLGLAGPLTGPNASLGAQLKRGAEQAVADINAEGGILGEKIEIVVGDDVSDPRQGVSVANRFVAEGVNWVVGHINSGVSIPASEVYHENNILQITPGSTSPTYTDRGMWNTFRTCGRDDQQGSVAGDFIAKHLAGKTVAIVHDKTAYGQGVAQETQKALNGAGVKETFFEGISPGEKDYTALVSKLKEAKADVVYFGGMYPEAGLIIRQMRDQSLDTVLVSGDGIVSNEFASIAGPGSAGTLMTFTADPRKIPENKPIVDKFLAAGFNPESYTLYAYAAVQIMKQAAEAAGSTDSQKMAEVMHSGKEFDTVAGKISYDEKGDMKDPRYVVYEWKPDATGKIDYANNEVE